jgi:hypothetical protein
MQCGVSLAFDDLLNGNITTDNTSFFMGVSTLATYLTNFQGNITTIINDFTTNLQTTVGVVNGNLSSAETNLGMLPNGTTANTSYVLSYSTPVPGASTVSSSFATVLGVASNSSSLTGTLFTIVDSLYSAISAMNTAISSLSSQTSISADIGTAAQLVSNYSSLISSTDQTVGTLFSTINPYLNYVRYASLGYFGAVIGLAVLALLGVIIMACFDKIGCRHLMYVSCVIMLIACIVGFVLSFILSVVIPVLYMTCTVITPAIASSTNFTSVTNTLGLPTNITSIASVCLPGGGGAILSQLGSSTINTQIGNVQTMMVNMQTYGSYDMTPLNSAISNVTNVINEYTYA